MSETEHDFDDVKIIREALERHVAAEWAKGTTIEKMKAKFGWETDEIAQAQLAAFVRGAASRETEN